MGWKKKVLIGSVSVVFILVALAVLFGDSETESSKTTGQVTGVTAQSLIIKSAREMLPVRSEIPTEFILEPVEDIKNAAQGMESGAMLSSDKMESSSSSVVVDYIVYKFTKSEDATNWYQTEVDKIVQMGGYKEIKLSESCFGYKEDFGFEFKSGSGLCIDRNVVFMVDAGLSYSFKSPDGFIKDGIKLLDKKVG